MKQTLELLSPARNAEVGRIAILAGADAVYIGAPAFGARAAAVNTVADIAALAAFAHRFRARVYVTMNTILFDNELEEARKLVWELYDAGVDALIVQDMAYLMMNLPPLALHASTQCDIRTPAKARLLGDAGFSQLVLPREYTLDQIKAARDAAGVPVEVFVHGALCVSYSGDCQAGFAAMGRSANRGVCPQMCRLPYRLTDATGKDVGPEKHYLSLRDMNRLDSLEELAGAGASSFKIEGRLKDARYVANVTAAYSQALDSLVARYPDRYQRSSAGVSSCGFTPDTARTFNRGYTDYFLHAGTRRLSRMASLDTPKWAGAEVGRVTAPYDRRKGFFTTECTTTPLANGDGLGFFDRTGRFVGFRLNRAEGPRLYPAQAPEGLEGGMTLYRNNDKAFFDILDRPDSSCIRTISVDMTLESVDDRRLCLTATDARGCRASIVFDSPCEQSRSDQSEPRRRTLAKLGETIYRLGTLSDTLGDRFVAPSVLTKARRDIISALDTVAEATYLPDRRRQSVLASDACVSMQPLTYHDNVANNLSRRFYEEYGATVSERALEVSPKPEGDLTVMSTRYCIRRELGACLREKGGKSLPSPLFLVNPSGRYRLDFDCRGCGMKVVRCAPAQ